jgi:dihydroorotate dehydrogenase electron transfer subunit
VSAGVPAPIRADAEVLANRAEGGANWRLRLRAAGWPGAEPGQFAMLSPGARAGAPRWDPLLPRPMAVYRSDGDELEILYKVTGRGTRLLAECRPSDEVRLVGPLGTPFALPASGEVPVLVGGGTGIASLYALAARCARASRVRVLLGARTAVDLMGGADFEALGVELRIATEDGSKGVRGRVTDLLEPILAAEKLASVYACGPTAMMRRAAELTAGGRQRCTVSLENHMACGFGVCLGCAVPRADGGFALVCRDGPVLDASRVAWTDVP